MSRRLAVVAVVAVVTAVAVGLTLGCATLTVKGATIGLVGEELARVTLEDEGYHVRRVERRTLSAKETTAILRAAGLKIDEKAQPAIAQATAEVLDVQASHNDLGQASVTLIKLSTDVFGPQDVTQTDHVGGTVTWGQRDLEVKTWCFSFMRDDVDPQCATRLMQALATASGAGSAP